MDKTNAPKDNIRSETKDVVTSTGSNDPNFNPKYEYTNSAGKHLIIENGFPRGGVKYTDPNGDVYVYAVFWTRITNETDSPLELKIDFPVDSYEVLSLPGKYRKIVVPPDTMTLDKFPLFNYGLAGIASFLDKNIHKPSSLKRTINPKESSAFYVVILSRTTEVASGILRTGLSLKGQDLFYRIKLLESNKTFREISDQEILCGSINLKNLTLQK